MIYVATKMLSNTLTTRLRSKLANQKNKPGQGIVLSNILVAESAIDSLAEMLLFCISYNTSEHAFALTYQARAPLRTGAITNPR